MRNKQHSLSLPLTIFLFITWVGLVDAKGEMGVTSLSVPANLSSEVKAEVFGVADAKEKLHNLGVTYHLSDALSFQTWYKSVRVACPSKTTQRERQIP